MTTPDTLTEQRAEVVRLRDRLSGLAGAWGEIMRADAAMGRALVPIAKQLLRPHPPILSTLSLALGCAQHVCEHVASRVTLLADAIERAGVAQGLEHALDGAGVPTVRETEAIVDDIFHPSLRRTVLRAWRMP